MAAARRQDRAVGQRQRAVREEEGRGELIAVATAGCYRRGLFILRQRMICYRVDRRRFLVGEIILPPGDHIDHLTERVRHAELLIRDTLRNGSDLRGGHLYVFADSGEAWRYWLHKSNRNVYAVMVVEADVLHRADTTLITKISRHLDEPHKANALADKYRAGDATRDGFSELIVRKATVTKVLYRSKL